MSAAKRRRGQNISKRLTKISQNSVQHVRKNLVERISHIRNVRLLVFEWALLVSAIILLAIAQIMLYHESYATISYTSGGTYTEATVGEISTLNPLFATSNSEKVLSKLMFATLTMTDYSGHTGMGLAEYVHPDDNGKTWRLKLKDNLKWSDGEAITNEDVLFTAELIQDESLNTNYSSNLSNVKISEEGDEIVFQLSTAYADFPSSLDIPLVPKHILGDTSAAQILASDFSSAPVTSGAFKFNNSQAGNSESENLTTVYLTKNENYYAGTPLIETFAVEAFADTTEIIAALNAGLVTGTAELAATDAGQITATDIYEKQTALNSGVYAFFNTSSGTLNNKKLRQAIQEGVNMEAVRAQAGDEIALDYPLLKSQVDLEEWPALPEYDLAAAQAIVAETEFDKSRSLQIATVSTGYLPAVAEEFARQLEELGFQAEVVTYEPGSDFLVNVVRPRSYDILIYEAELGASPDLLAYYHSSQASTTGLNLSNYRNSIASDLILAARSTLDTELATKKYENFLKNWVSDVPAMGIYQTNLSYFFNKNTQNFDADNHLVVATDRFVDVQNWSAVQTTAYRTP